MPLGAFIAEVVVGGIVQAVISKPLIAFFRLPGALIGWAIWRKRTWQQVWTKGDAFAQGFAGFFLHATWISVLAASCN